jgi:hypothetical protein
MAATRSTPSPPIGGHVHLPREALDAVPWLDGEAVRSVWPIPEGFLVVTNLRAAVLGRDEGIFRSAAWHGVAEYFFFNFADPHPEGANGITLAQEFDDLREATVEVADPVVVLAELREARTTGRLLWVERRARSGAPPPVERPMIVEGPGHRPVVAVVAKLPCSYCGNLFDARVGRCPYCSAPRGPR